jgi:hypothetical protein
VKALGKAEHEFFSADTVEWTDLGGGLAERVLSGDPTTGHYTRMLRFAPGTVTPETLRHDFWEEVWIVDGAIRDLRLDETFTAGMYACRPPGMPHGPWEAPDGCTTFEVRYILPADGDWDAEEAR